ncbi:hypothetical protein D3C86_1787460 [compost metagenome]
MAIAFLEQLPAQRHHVRQVHLDPRHLAIVQAVETGVEAGRQVDDECVRVRCQEPGGGLVEDLGA